jgi:hypothetical protein
MKKSEVYWGILSATFTSLLLITLHILFGKFFYFGFFLLLAGFLGLLFFLISLEMVMKDKAAFKAAFLTGLLALGIFTGVLCTGLFESIVVSSDSYIDTSWGAVVLQIRNSGLSDVNIQTITVGDITYTPIDYSGQKYELSLERGQNALLIVHYRSGDLAYNRISPEIAESTIQDNPWGVLFLSNVYVTPLTYSAGEKYVVILKTQLKEHHSQIEAKLTAEENLEILDAYGRIYGNEEIGIFFELNKTHIKTDGSVDPPICIYSIQIGNMTIEFHPCVRVGGTTSWEPEWWREYWFWVRSDGEIDCHPPYLWEGNAEVKPEPDLAAFVPYELYEVVFWTLANKTYRCTMTFLPTQ